MPRYTDAVTDLSHNHLDSDKRRIFSFYMYDSEIYSIKENPT